MDRLELLDLLKSLSFGARVAEDETAALARYFVETDQWNRIFRNEIDVVRGTKGAGKSAIYSLLTTKTDELFDKKTLLVTAEQPRGATVFKDLVTDPPTSESEFTALWKLYLVALVAQKIKEYGIDAGSQDFKKLVGLLEEQELLESDFNLSRLFKQVRTYARSWFIPKSVEGAFAIDPTTGFPTFAGKITPNELTVDLRTKGYVSVDTLADLANRVLAVL